MKIQFLGAVRTVTGSMYLLTVNGSKILLECGLFQGKRQESFERNSQLPFDPPSIDAMVLSHAHIDHAGNIPSLVKNGFAGPIYATPATRDLCVALLRDSGHIQEEDAQFVNKKRAKKGEPPVEPLYTIEDAEVAINSFSSNGYDRPFQAAPGVTVTFRDAGHILGSAIVVLDIEENGTRSRLVFSGDLGRKGMAILRDPVVVQDIDYLLIESTYGDRHHAPVEDTEKALRDVVVDTYHRGGKLIVPAFAVGRTQELIYALHRLTEQRDIPTLPIYVDSPLAINVTEVFRLHPECFDRELNEFLAGRKGHDPFGFDGLSYTRTTAESKELNFLRHPAIIISASGMCEAGRVLHHLKNNIEDTRNTILIVGWQAPDTLGRRLVEHAPVVKIFGEEYTVRARVETINGFSAHADRAELLDYVKQAGAGRLKAAYVVHGDEASSLALAEGLRDLSVAKVTVPRLGETLEL